MSTINNTYITVGIIVKNEAKNIRNTLQYLFEQSYLHESFEIIIADGNSNDGTREIAENILKKNNVQYKIINEKDAKNKDGGYNYGHSFARNIIIDHSDERAKYIAWIDGDCRADKDWLKNLWECIEKNTDPKIAGAGGRRIVENNEKISKKELMLNYYFTSKIMSLGNPAFCDSDVVHMSSIAGYNSIYYKEILKKYRYNTSYPFNIDDIEINFRLSQDGYTFLHAKTAHIYHRMDEEISIFFKQMINYGKGAMNTSKIHKKIARIYLPIGILYLIYVALLPILIYTSQELLGNSYIPLIPYFFVLLISIAVFIENYQKTHNLMSLHVLYIVFLHPLMYGWGALKSIYRKNKQKDVIWILGSIEYRNSGVTLFNSTLINVLDKEIKIKQIWIQHKAISINRILKQFIYIPIKLILNPATLKIFPDESWIFIINFFHLRNSICVIHDIRNFDLSTTNKTPIQRIYFRLVTQGIKNLNNLKGIVVPSNSTKEKVEQLGVSPNKIRVIYNIIDEDIFNIEDNKELFSRKKELFSRYNIDSKHLDKMVLLYVGSEEDRKNLITTLGAIRNINPNNYILIKIGKAIINSNRNKHQDYISSNNINAIFIDNIESNEELANWYKISDIYIFPTLFEGFGRTAIEAQACGCPVITTKADGVNEIVGDSGLIMNDPLSTNELYEGIMKISNNGDLREKLVQKGIKNAKKFSKQTNKNIILEMFQDNLI